MNMPEAPTGDLEGEDGIFNASIFMHFNSPSASPLLHTKATPSHINPRVKFQCQFSFIKDCIGICKGSKKRMADVSVGNCKSKSLYVVGLKIREIP